MSDQRALNQPAEIPPELDRWNWGAFLLNWIWGIGNSTFIALLALIPFVGFIMMIVLGVRGSRWAWRNRAWRDAEHFRNVQRKWAIAGAIIWAVMIALAVGLVFGLPGAMKRSEAYQMTMSMARADPRVTEALGTTLKDAFWIEGNVNVELGGGGNAVFAIPVTGEKGSGTVHSTAVRTAGVWHIRLLVVTVDGSDKPIVIVNEDKVNVPGVPLEL